MSISAKTKYVLYSPKNNVAWDDYEINSIIHQLLNIIDKNRHYFLVIATILEVYNSPDDDINVQKKRNKALLTAAKLYPEIKNNHVDVMKISNLLDRLYQMSSQEVGDIRGKVLEAVIYKYGPRNFVLTTKTEKCLEAIITFESQRIGVNECDFDFTFHDKNGDISFSPDYFECKATIDGSVKLGQPMNLLKPSKFNKWEYAKSVFDQLHNLANLKPNIYFACLNTYTQDFQNHINTNGYGCVEILGHQKIFSMIN